MAKMGTKTPNKGRRLMRRMPKEYLRPHYRAAKRKNPRLGIERDAHIYGLVVHDGYAIGPIAEHMGYGPQAVKDMVKRHRRDMQYAGNMVMKTADEMVEEAQQEIDDLLIQKVETPAKVFDDDVLGMRKVGPNQVSTLCNISRGDYCRDWVATNYKVDAGGEMVGPTDLAWQLQGIWDVMAPITDRKTKLRLKSEDVISMAIRSGKSEFAAMLICLFMFSREAVSNTKLVVAAYSKEQAGQLFDKVVMAVNANPELLVRADINERSRVMRIKKGKGPPVEFRAIANKPETIVGWGIYLAIMDELSQFRDDRMLQALRGRQAHYKESLMVVISTSSDIPNNPMANEIESALKATDPASGEGIYDPRIDCHIYRAPPDAAFDDMDAIRQACPSLGVSPKIEWIEQQISKARREPAHQDWLLTNIHNRPRGGGRGAIVNTEKWRECHDKGLKLSDLRGKMCYGGLDLGRNQSFTAFALYFPEEKAFWTWPFLGREMLDEWQEEDHVNYRGLEIDGYMETTSGRKVDFAYVARRVAEIVEDFDVRLIGYDRWEIGLFNNALEQHDIKLGADMSESWQSGRYMHTAIMEIQGLVSEGELRHRGNPIDTRGIHLTGAKMKGDYYKAEKRHQYARNDTVMALLYAMGQAINHTGTKMIDWSKVAADMGIIEKASKKIDETEEEEWERDLRELAAI